jgi:hypothetical protein
MALGMKLNEALNLVVPITGTISAYHCPISHAVFEANYRILAATKAALFGDGLKYAATVGPTVAALTLADMGRRDAAERGEFTPSGDPADGGAGSLLAEIKRLTTVLAPGANGWDYLPVDTAIQAGHMDLEDWKEAEASIVFFTCLVSMARKATRERQAMAAASAMDALTTPLSLSEYAASLPKSTGAETSPDPVVSSVPL